MKHNIADRRSDAAGTGTYDIYIEIDRDCEELVDAVGLNYEQCEDDPQMNEVCISLTPDEFKDEFNFSIADNYWNETAISSTLLNPELGEYTTKVTIYKPSGDIISFC